MSPCSSPTGSVLSGSTQTVQHLPRGGVGDSGGGGNSCSIVNNSGIIGINPISPSANGNLRAKEHILTNTIPGPESCV